jgi:uncharacterized protein YcbK (DUF882 family)
MFLRGGAAALLAGIASPALAGLKDTGAKSLSFDNLHTGEKLSVDYWVNGQYVPQALQSIDVVLRDFRNGEIHAIDPKLLDLLNLLHRELDSSVPFSIISGYRSPATNAQLHERSSGVAVKSLHMQGMAADIRLSDRDLSVLHRTAVKMQVGGVGYYPSSDFVHVDVGRVRYWGAKDPSIS